MPGIDDVARAAGVSAATVSRALNGQGRVSEATRERVQLTARELGYDISTAASSLASGRTRAVGVILPYLSNWFYTHVLDGAQAALAGFGYDLTLYNLGGGDGERRRVFEQFLFRRRVDAMIAVGLEVTPDEVASIHAVAKPTVCVGGPIPGLHTLSVDDVGLGSCATRHLVELGHRRIAHVAGGTGVYPFDVTGNRRRGYEHTLRAAGITRDPALEMPCDFSMEGGYRAAIALLNAPNPPTAIFADSDEIAIGTILAARELGISVPDELSVIGIDDHELAGFFGLSTVAQYPRLQGQRAVEALMGEFGVLAPPASANEGNIELPFDLIERSSTARPTGR